VYIVQVFFHGQPEASGRRRRSRSGFCRWESSSSSAVFLGALAGDLPPLARSQLLGVGVGVFPSPVTVGRRRRLLE
jgi:hypothetical protein